MFTAPVASSLAAQATPRTPIARSATHKLYLRQDGETSKAYEAFCIYRDMGWDRTLTKVAEKLNCSVPLVCRWSARWRWDKRLTAYLNDLDTDKIRRHKVAVEEMNSRHRKIALVFQERIAERLATLDINEMSPKDLAQWVQVAVELERATYGLSKVAKFDQNEQGEAIVRFAPEMQTFDEQLSQLPATDRAILRDISVKYIRAMKLEFTSQVPDARPDSE